MLNKKATIFILIFLFFISIIFLYKAKERYEYKYERLKADYKNLNLAKETSNKEFDKIKKFFIEENKTLSFYSSSSEIKSLGSNKILIEKFSNPLVIYSGQRSSLEYHDEKVYMITGKGDIYVNSSLRPINDQINFLKIRSNLRELVDQDYLNHYQTIFKDIIIKNSINIREI